MPPPDTPLLRTSEPRDPARPRIVIVGGGAGGLELATRLGEHLGRRGRAEVVLVDAALAHLWKPLLHEVAAGTRRAPAEDVEYLRQARRHGFRFHLGRMDGLDRANRRVWLAPLQDDRGEEVAPRRALLYDWLVLAVGSVVHDFGTAGVAEHAIALDEADDARAFHRRLLSECARAEARDDGPVPVVIVGGGATGVELAAELVEAGREIASHGARLSVLGQPIRVTLVEAGPRLLAALGEDLAAEVRDDLAARGVEVRTGERVVAVERRRVVFDGGDTVPAALTVWAAGIRGPDVLASVDGLARNRLGQVQVDATLRTLDDPHVFAIGDCAAVAVADGEPPVPPRAQTAHQQARVLAASFDALLRGGPARRFRFRDRGVLVTLGRSNAVGRLRPAAGARTVPLHGLAARAAYWLLERRHMALLDGWSRTLLATVAGWLGGFARPRVKLH